MKIKRVFLIVADSLGIGECPDSNNYYGSDGKNDCGSNTLASISKSEKFSIENLLSLGISDIDGQGYLARGKKIIYRPAAISAVARLAEKSAGKDTTTGHFEIAGLYINKPFPTYPDGFPDEVTDAFSALTGRGILCNKPYSGTKAIKDYGDEHIKTGKLIVYTSGDSVFQVAAHNDVMSEEELYSVCIAAREKILCGEHNVGRVIARPFAGKFPDFYRTDGRRDFSVEPPGETLLDFLVKNNRDVISVGKIRDIFAHRGISREIVTHSNDEGMCAIIGLAKEVDFNGLCFANLVDFDMLYGHRNDIDGYAAAISEFDRALGTLLPLLGDEDVLMITADHGCDPATLSTDHSREYVPLIVYGGGNNGYADEKSGCADENMPIRTKPVNLGTRAGFCDIAATVADFLGLSYEGGCGNSFAKDI